jgi:hypothetical protein
MSPTELSWIHGKPEGEKGLHWKLQSHAFWKCGKYLYNMKKMEDGNNTLVEMPWKNLRGSFNH